MDGQTLHVSRPMKTAWMEVSVCDKESNCDRCKADIRYKIQLSIYKLPGSDKLFECQVCKYSRYCNESASNF